jgi:ketosteroid isomerase-like protein
VNTDIAAIKEVLNQYAMGCTAGDLDLWMSLWANDGVQMPPDAPALVGKEEIRSAAKPEFDDLDMNLTILSIEDAKITGGLGLTRCVYKSKAIGWCLEDCLRLLQLQHPACLTKQCGRHTRSPG